MVQAIFSLPGEWSQLEGSRRTVVRAQQAFAEQGGVFAGPGAAGAFESETGAFAAHGNGDANATAYVPAPLGVGDPPT